LGVRAKFVIAVSNLDGQLLGLYRMKDATVFSIDVAVTKSRTVVYFSGSKRLPDELPGVPLNTAVTNRTIEFGTEPLYPPGINNSGPGPWFNLYIKDVTVRARRVLSRLLFIRIRAASSFSRDRFRFIRTAH